MALDKAYREILSKLDRILAILEPKAPAAPPAKAAEPIPGYDALNVAEALDALSDHKHDRALIASALAYERANKRRAGVIETLVNWNS